MFKALIVIVVSGAASFYFTDLGSEAAFYAIVLPIIDALILMALALWLVLFFHQQGIDEKTVSGAFPEKTDGGNHGCGGADGV